MYNNEDELQESKAIDVIQIVKFIQPINILDIKDKIQFGTVLKVNRLIKGKVVENKVVEYKVVENNVTVTEVTPFGIKIYYKHLQNKSWEKFIKFKHTKGIP